mmetsp:Transcript_59157/g.138406  ORF Transcript_59157/g.138406 Transcript_59157/m.138406 type:complete len:436 (+) Transcript_59157:916-2223(+)
MQVQTYRRLRTGLWYLVQRQQLLSDGRRQQRGQDQAAGQPFPTAAEAFGKLPQVTQGFEGLQVQGSGGVLRIQLGACRGRCRPVRTDAEHQPEDQPRHRGGRGRLGPGLLRCLGHGGGRLRVIRGEAVSAEASPEGCMRAAFLRHRVAADGGRSRDEWSHHGQRRGRRQRRFSDLRLCRHQPEWPRRRRLPEPDHQAPGGFWPGSVGVRQRPSRHGSGTDSLAHAWCSDRHQPHVQRRGSCPGDAATFFRLLPCRDPGGEVQDSRHFQHQPRAPHRHVRSCGREPVCRHRHSRLRATEAHLRISGHRVDQGQDQRIDPKGSHCPGQLHHWPGGLHPWCRCGDEFRDGCGSRGRRSHHGPHSESQFGFQHALHATHGPHEAVLQRGLHIPGLRHSCLCRRAGLQVRRPTSTTHGDHPPCSAGCRACSHHILGISVL